MVSPGLVRRPRRLIRCRSVTSVGDGDWCCSWHSNSTVTITATKTDYVPGSGHTTVKSLEAAHEFGFENVTRTQGGFTVPLTNFDANDPYTWAIKASR